MKPLKLITVFLILIMIAPYHVKGASISMEEPASAFATMPILPDNQHSNVSYYDLQMPPGTQQLIQLKVLNNERTPITARIQLNAAATGRNGSIVYDSIDAIDESLKVPITEIAAVTTPIIQIPPKSEKLVGIAIQMPDSPITGTILGGLVVTASKAAAMESTDTAAGIQHQYAFITAIKITQSDSHQTPDFVLQSIKPCLVNYHTAIAVNLQNREPAIVKGMNINGGIYEAGNSDIPLQSIWIESADVSPNSNFDLIFDWKDAPIKAGEYRLRLKAVYEEQVWEWDELFTIDEGNSAAVNDTAVNVKTDRTLLNYLWILALLWLFFIVFKIGKYIGEQEKD